MESLADKAPNPSIPSKPGSFNLGEIRNPNEAIDCILQLNDDDPVGSLHPRIDGLTYQVSLDGGRTTGSPGIDLKVKWHGSQGRDVARADWHVDASPFGRWSIQHINHGFIKDTPEDQDINNVPIISQCEDQKLERLICITLILTPLAPGYLYKPPRKTSVSEKANLLGIFKAKEDFNLRIWFIAPFSPNQRDLDMTSLVMMRASFEQRQKHFGSADHRSAPAAKRQRGLGSTAGASLPTTSAGQETSSVQRNRREEQPTSETEGYDEDDNSDDWSDDDPIPPRGLRALLPANFYTQHMNRWTFGPFGSFALGEEQKIVERSHEGEGEEMEDEDGERGKAVEHEENGNDEAGKEAEEEGTGSS